MQKVAIDFPAVNDCIFLKSSAQINAALPPFVELDRSQKLLTFTYNFKRYSLGISKDGLLCGFRGSLNGAKRAEILILRDPATQDFKVYDSRHTDGEKVANDLEEVPAADIWAEAIQAECGKGLFKAPVAAQKPANFAFFGAVSYEAS